MKLSSIRRKWCRGCQTRTPHYLYWFEDTEGTCIFWKPEGICGCSILDEEGPTKPNSPCSGGFATSFACCKCFTPKWDHLKGWTRIEDPVKRFST